VSERAEEQGLGGSVVVKGDSPGCSAFCRAGALVTVGRGLAVQFELQFEHVCRV
jgi:hypothetical protein